MRSRLISAKAAWASSIEAVTHVCNAAKTTDGGTAFVLMSVAISGPPFTAGRPVELFQTPLTVNRALPSRDRRFDVAPDGRFLMVIPSATGAPTPYSVIVNWTNGLEK